MTLFINIGMWQTRLNCSVRVETMDCAQLLALFYWLQYRLIEKLKGDTMRKVWKKQRANEAKHEESTIDDMHVLIFPLGSIDSVLYPVIAPVCKQHTGVSLPFHSAPAIPVTRYM